MPFRRWLPNVLLALIGSAILFAVLIAQARRHRKSKPIRGNECA
ncbi:MAG TPA: hypothetical protein VHI72_17375 [Hyphomicrobiaceae bacterium]|jgi:hypothetical protein|nr:hypothetical protein [Hyphomicrobiaceae bacterium]